MAAAELDRYRSRDWGQVDFCTLYKTGVWWQPSPNRNEELGVARGVPVLPGGMGGRPRVRAYTG